MRPTEGTYICVMRPTKKTYTLTLSRQAEWSRTHFETLHEAVEVADDGQVAVCCSVLQCVAVCCSVLQCVAVCYSVLQFVAVCCSVLKCVAV